MARLTCPYCYRQFAERDMLFRCSGLRAADGKFCRPAPDPVRVELGDRDEVPPVVVANGRKLSAVCPQCGNTATIQLCPHCHAQLPVHYGKLDTRMVAMIGAKFSGKSVFTTVLMHELIHRVGRRFDAAVLGADERTRREFGAEEHALYTDRVLPATTRPARADEQGRQPFVFKFSLGERKRFRSTLRHTVLSFFDTAGEDLESARGVAQNVGYLSSADGIIVLLDPLTVPGLPATLGLDPSLLPGPAAAGDTPLNILTRVTEVLQNLPGTGPHRMIDVPVAIAFSKVDVLWEALPADSPLRQPAPDEPFFPERDSVALHDHVQALLQEWEGGQIDQLLHKHYRTYRYFALSALGAVPSVGIASRQRVAESGIQPHRVADPFLWLLSRLKVIETGRD
ncbi:hypothetical protein ACWT_8074 [Actinoplanes sp. SE50]|uniref:hypothetical protein n=1 Tax=unclassified Actinoplanes TaxID=2626549 RepID=UPI00023EDCC5|nr:MULTISPECIES: hypothetical protein [unclassified Actinoplanes]AEV89083.1 hypothetical protein ACPL_8205 [Actinoplanes sp. SE50/110]ATO87489.1 hypothetical protein ACWT_8074 [Actinoplanes sp. SE50]SLM04907.1 hypothetical protein ACSP50_8219 [Actinoplanes sp. SE50/110]